VAKKTTTKKYGGYRQAQRPFTPAEDKLIRAQRLKGKTGAEIALELHCHKGAVHRRLREMGLSYKGFWSEMREMEKKKAAKAKSR
jgi:DNA-directed RNA polymerase specialized sigma24 family protein